MTHKTMTVEECRIYNREWMRNYRKTPKGQAWILANKEKNKALSEKWRFNNPDKRKASSRRSAKYHRDFIRTFKAVPCLDCGNKFPPECMDFDHRDPKTKLFTIGGIRRSRTKVLAEIAKCDLVCANCHRIRTEKRRYGKNI